MYYLRNNGEIEIDVKKSRFIAYATRVETIDEAQEIIQERRKQHFKARHHCSAFIIGDHQNIQRSSDDGEPSGTAGVPILEVLKQNELTNTLIVVTRYFGGIKLGKGGLIRAYSSAASTAIDELGIVQPTLQDELILTLDYSLFDPLQHDLEQQEVTIGEIQYTDKIQMQIFCDQVITEAIEQHLIQQFNNQIHLEIGQPRVVEKTIKKGAND